MNLRNKRGAEKLMSVYWFAILILVAGTIVYMVSVFYGNPYDVREIETNILINKVADCLSDKGKLRYQLTEELKTNFLEKCHLNFGNENEELEYYLEIEFYNFDNNNLLDFSISEGNINLKNYIEDFPGSNSVISTSKSFYVLNDKDEELIVKILSIIRKTEKNVK
ncbi:MAG: hypothetical protein IIA85_03175 [Nanoarchaeota archaeon]|nr:hypothetical protein [Nanoarchaeota archaeon]